MSGVGLAPAPDADHRRDGPLGFIIIFISNKYYEKQFIEISAIDQLLIRSYVIISRFTTYNFSLNDFTYTSNLNFI